MTLAPNPREVPVMSQPDIFDEPDLALERGAEPDLGQPNACIRCAHWGAQSDVRETDRWRFTADTNPRTKPQPRLERVAFRSSRLLEFCSEKELTLQTGHPASDWPLVVAKELIDNALDACEEAGVAPVVTVTVGDGIIEVADNGPGLPEATLDGVLDYTVRASSREAYVSPTRGAQGNALKTVLAMPYAIAGAEQRGRVEIEANGQRDLIEFAVDHIRQEPVIRRSAEPCDRHLGTSVLHVVEPPPGADDRLAWGEPDDTGDDAGLGQVAPIRADLAALVRARAPAAPDRCLHQGRRRCRPPQANSSRVRVRIPRAHRHREAEGPAAGYRPRDGAAHEARGG
jgi:hypothetical protein